MKFRFVVLLVLAPFAAGCHRSEAALSANGVKIGAGQTVQAVGHAFACMSAESLKQAVALRAAGDKAQLYSLFKAQQCEFFEPNEHLKVTRVEPQGDGYQALVVADLDDTKAPPAIWVRADEVSAQ